MTTTEFIFGITALPAATLAWLKAVSRHEARIAQIKACRHDFYEKYEAHLNSWKLYCHRCHYQDDITAQKLEEERRGDLGDR